MSNQVKVKQQTEVGSKNWGVYVDGKLVEGGFFTKGAALDCAEEWRKQLQASAGNRV
jgi:hypothetical protein